MCIAHADHIRHSSQLEIDELTIESAKSSLAYNTASKESTINDAVGPHCTSGGCLD